MRRRQFDPETIREGIEDVVLGLLHHTREARLRASAMKTELIRTELMSFAAACAN
jgi:hypothetical protein